MKPIMLITTILLLIAANLIVAQKNTIPQVNLYKLSGEQINSLEVLDGKDAAIVIFWKTSDRNSQDHISDMINAHQEILATKNVRLIGICIDGEGTISHILPYVMGNSWEIEMYADKNSDFKRAMNIVDTPSTIVLNTGNQVICQYIGYCTGTEEMICDKLLDCLGKKSTKESFALVE